MKRSVICLIAVLGVAAVLCAQDADQKSTPAACLAMAQKAFKDHDGELFQTYVNVETVSQDLVYGLVGGAIQSITGEAGYVETLKEEGVLKPMVTWAQEQLLSYVTKREHEKEYVVTLYTPTGQKSEEYIMSLDFVENKMHYFLTTEPKFVAINKETANITITVSEPGVHDTFIITAAKNNDQWMLTNFGFVEYINRTI